MGDIEVEAKRASNTRKGRGLGLPVQVRLYESDATAVAELAAARQVSAAEIVRDLVRDGIGAESSGLSVAGLAAVRAAVAEGFKTALVEARKRLPPEGVSPADSGATGIDGAPRKPQKPSPAEIAQQPDQVEARAALLRCIKGLGQGVAATKLGFSQATVSRWNNGIRTIPHGVAELIYALSGSLPDTETLPLLAD